MNTLGNLGSCSKPGQLAKPAAQVLALSKMDWNTDALYDSLPATVSYAQVLANVVKHEKLPPSRTTAGCSCNPGRPVRYPNSRVPRFLAGLIVWQVRRSSDVSRAQRPTRGHCAAPPVWVCLINV
jgi:hypothetical protein